MSKTVRDKQIVIRISALPRSELERAAAENDRPLANQARLVLIDYATRRVTEREQRAA